MRAILQRARIALTRFLQARDGPFRGVYSSFASAQAAIKSGRRAGYDHAEAAEIYRHEMLRVRTSDYAIMYWLEKILLPNVRIFDWGGNLGHSYYVYRSYLTYPHDLTWTICDVPEIVRSGRQLALDAGDAPGLVFTERPSDCEGCDVLLFNGSLQFIPISLESFLAGLRVKPKHIFINRIPVHETRTYFTLQDVGPVVCPYQIFGEAMLLEMLQRRGYELRDRWPCEGKSVHIAFQPSATVGAFSGFYFQLNPKLV